MKRSIDNLSAALAAGILLLTLSPCEGQGTITFDGYPPLPPTSGILLTSYAEQGMRFTGIGPSGQFGKSGGAEVNVGFPRNGGAYIYAMFQQPIRVDSLYGARFGLVSVDVAEFSTLYAYPLTIPFIGYRADGSTVTNEFITDGIIDGAGPLSDFETLHFDSRFADVVRVEIPTDTWSLDNMVFSNVVPEPGVFGLMSIGISLIGIELLRRKLRSPR